MVAVAELLPDMLRALRELLADPAPAIRVRAVAEAVRLYTPFTSATACSPARCRRRSATTASGWSPAVWTCCGQNGCWTPNQTCTGVAALTVLATSSRSVARSMKLKMLRSTRTPPPTAWATPPTLRPAAYTFPTS